MSHDCPVPGCPTCVGDHKLMCQKHYYLLPQALRSRLYATWNTGKGSGTSEHRQAMHEAIQHLEVTHAETK